jgi:membrane fusion protein (multidrug efflux system)
VGQEEIAHTQTQVISARSTQAAAQAVLATAREALAAQQTQTDGLALAEQPAVAEAAARVREAYLALRRSTLPSPQAGVVARRNVQIGQRVAAGTPLMTVVALDQLWVDANFKEPQLERLRIGQPVKLTADVYGRQRTFDGRIASLGAGTGAAFALLPAQNATGNWIKVVQRVPVRIALDAKQLAAHPLRLGLSTTVSVDVSDTSGRTLADVARSAPVAQTQVFDVITAQADAEVARIIATHGGAQRRPAAVPAKAVKPAAALTPAAPVEPATARHAAPDKTIPARPTNPATRR